MKRLKKLSLIDLSIHDLRRALRSPNFKLAPYDLLKQLVEQRQKATREYSGGLLLSLVLLTWLYSTGSDHPSYLSFATMGISVDVRITFVLLAIGGGLFSAVDGMRNYTMVDQQIAEVSKSFGRHGNPSIIVSTLDVSSANSATLQFRYTFWEFGRRLRILRSIQSGWLGFIILLTAVLMYLGFVVGEARTMFSSDVGLVDRFVVILAFMLATYPIFSFVLILVPTNLVKNQSYLRWSFLAPIHRRSRIPLPHHWFPPKKGP